MKTYLTILFLLLVTINVKATDITIGATTQPNFNPSNLSAAVTITSVTVTNGTNATLTCSSCFRPQWVGMSGFYITVGLNNYYVKSVDSVSQVTLTGACNESSPATVVWNPYVEFRIYADRAFQPLGKSYIVQPGTPGSGAWYKRYGASILTVNGVKTLHIPELVIDATTDAVGPTNQARYTAGFYRPDNSLIQYYACADQFRVPATTPTSWGALCQFNSPPAIVPPANEAYTKTQIDARLIPCSVGQMIYYAATGNQPTCLTVGTGLTITSGSILTTGGLRQVINAADYGCNLADTSDNDTTCLSNAINAARAVDGRTLYLPTGTYNVDAITVSLNRVIIEGDGPSKSIIKARGTNYNVINVTSAGYGFKVTLRDLAVHGYGKAAGTSGHCIYITDSNSFVSEFELDNLEIQNCRQDGINIPFFFNGIIKRVVTDNIGQDHFDLGGASVAVPAGANTVTLLNNYVKTVEAWRVGYRIRTGGVTMIGNNGMAPNSAVTAMWGLFGQKYIVGTADTSLNSTTITDVKDLEPIPNNIASYFKAGDEITIAGAGPAGSTLTTIVTAVNSGANMLTVLDAASVAVNNGSIQTTDLFDSYFRGALLGNNIEDFGTRGVRLKDGSKFGSISGNSFLSSTNAGTHIALQFDYAGEGYSGAGTTPAGFFDQSNSLVTQAGSWANGAAVHSQGVPFLVAGNVPSQYYETSFPALVDLPTFTASWDSTYNKMFLRNANFQTDNLKIGVVNFSTLSGRQPVAGITLFCSNCKPHSSTQVCELDSGGSPPGAIVTGNGTSWICH